MHMKLCIAIRNFMGLVTLLFCREKPKAVSDYLTSKQILPFGFARQYTAHFRRPFINARVFINTRRKCAARAYKRTVVFKWAVI